MTGGAYQRVNFDVEPVSRLHLRRSDKWAGHSDGIISSTIAEMDFPIAEPIADALHAAIARSDLGYAPHAVPRLAAAFEGFAARRLGWTIDPEQVSVVPDVMVGILELARALTVTGESVAFSTPAYPPFLSEVPLAQLSTKPIPLSSDGTTDLEALESAFASGTRIFVLANPHNPTGRALPRNELAQIAKLAAAHDAWVIADEIHGPLTLSDAEFTPFLEASDEARARGFALTSASKAFNLAGLKTALVVTADKKPRQVMDQLIPMTDHTGILGVIAAEAAFAEGDDWLDAVLAQLEDNRNLLSALLPDRLPAVRWIPPQASYLAWLDFGDYSLGDDAATTILQRGAVALSPGREYSSSARDHARLNFGTSPEIIVEMIDRIAAAVD